MERNLWAEPMLLKRCILRSRRRVGWCEFSARLLRGHPRSCRFASPRSRVAAPYDASSSVTSLSGTNPVFFQQLPHQFQGCTLVPFGLEQNVQDLTFRIYRTPEIDQTAADPETDFIEMPDGVRLGPAFTQVRRNGGVTVETAVAGCPPCRSRRALLTHRACMGFRMSSADNCLGFIYLLIRVASNRGTRGADCWAFLRRSEGNPPLWRGSSRHKLVFG